MDWVGGLETQPLAETTGLQRINLHVPPPPPATFGGSKLHPSHLQIRTSQLLSPAVLCKDSLDSAEIKANNKKQNKPTAGHCLLQIHRLLSAASATPGWQAASPPPPPAVPCSWAGGNCPTRGRPSLSPTDPQRPHPKATEVTPDILLLSPALGSVCSPPGAGFCVQGV